MVGCGPGGLSAALAAARTRISVISVERFSFFGSNITAVGVEGFAWCRHEGTIDSEGIDREFENRAIEMGATVPEPKSDSHTLGGEAFKVVADNIVLEAGIMPILHCCFVALVMEGKRIKGIITESKAGREVILSGRVTDATGVGDVARRSGPPMCKTPKEEMIVASVMCSMSGVDCNAFIDDLKENPRTSKIRKTANRASRPRARKTPCFRLSFASLLKKPWQRN